MSDSLLIPDDLAACRTLIGELARTVTELADANTQLRDANTKLEQLSAEQQLQIRELIQRGFLKRPERYLEDPGQLKLDFGGTDDAADASEGLAQAIEDAELIIGEHQRRRQAKQKTRNEQLPDHLPRYEVEAESPDDVKLCPQHGARTLIGHDRIETLEFEPPQLKVRVTLIPKYACPQDASCGVSEAPRAKGLVEGNRYDTSVAAEIITAKYGYHLPIYRQQDWFAGSGWTPGRSTLLNILRASAELVEPFIEFLRGEVLASGLIGTDETRVTLLLPPEIPAAVEGDAKSRRIHEVFTAARVAGKPSVSGRMWVYRSVLLPVNVFDFTVSRHRDGPDEFLVEADFHGTLMADCYSGYQNISLRSDDRIVRAACNSHARRKIFDARENHPLLASGFLSLYQQLYDIEDRARQMTPDDRQVLRDREAPPVWARLRQLLDSDATAQVLPKDAFAEALTYLRNQWDALQVYLDDGGMPMDNNETEQLMKQVALGRKNWMFIGSVAAGERAADVMTLVSSAVRNDLDVWSYVKDVLDQLLAGRTDYAPLRPDRWAASHPQAIRTYRTEERRDRADAKRTRRAHRRKKRLLNTR